MALILGAGGVVGDAVRNILKKQGYAVAVGSRNPDVEAAKRGGFFAVKVDAGDPKSVQEAFDKVNKELGPPSVVIHNGACLLSILVRDLVLSGH